VRLCCKATGCAAKSVSSAVKAGRKVSIAKGANAASDASTTDKNNGGSLVIDLIYVSTFKNQTFNKKAPVNIHWRIHLTTK
jgi:hypothetical protein